MNDHHQKLTRLGVTGAGVLAALHGQAFAEADGSMWDEGDFARILALPATIALIAKTEGRTPRQTSARQPAGFVVFTQVRDESEILTLGVLPEARGLGVGNRLVGAVIDAAGQQGVSTVFLEVREDNEAALALYGRHGFLAAGRRKDYYRLAGGRVVDAIIMRHDMRYDMR